MKRRSPIKRTSGLARTATLPRVNRKRRQSEFARTYGSKARVAFVKSLPCVVRHCGDWRIENAHTETGGMGRKADASTIAPICQRHHRELHQVGTHTFQAVHRVDLAACAAATDAAWQREQERAA
jgi:hypothetical protein